jgi:LTXXQ motif family protein
MKLGIAALLVALAGPAAAQQHQHGPPPYAGLQHRAVKALSDQQISDLRAGRGMGLALAAELNGYPGPIHALELADRLQLTADQREHIQQLYEAMKAEAISVGEKLIAHETALDRHFSERKATPASLASLTAHIGETQGELRAVHLKYHLTTAAVLTADQMQRYAELRGYR